MKRSILIATVLLLHAGLLAGAGAAEYNREVVRGLVTEALPPFDDSLLRVVNQPNWAAQLRFDAIAAAMRDEPFLPAEIPPEAGSRIATETRVVRFEPDRGLVRYLNRRRAWVFIADPAQRPPFIASSTILGNVVRALDAINLPRTERVPVSVATNVTSQFALQSSVRATAPPSIRAAMPMYRIVSVKRRNATNGLPVLGSGVTAAVGPDGLVQRMLVKWRPFQINPAVRLRARTAVLDQAFNAIVAERPAVDNQPIEIKASLAYSDRYDGLDVRDAEQRGENRSPFLPVALFSVTAPIVEGRPPAGFTPFQILVPLAE